MLLLPPSPAKRVTRSAPEQKAEPGARDDDRAQVGMRQQVAAELVAEIAVEGVAPLLAIDGREPDEAPLFEVDHELFRIRR